MARCMYCGEYLEPEEGVTVDPDTCDDCMGFYNYPMDPTESYSDADSGL
jgi:hypothetical protein